MDLGRIVAREIFECADKNSGFLFFPCLITELCMMQGVPINGNEQGKFPHGPFSVEFKLKQELQKNKMV